MSTSPPDVTLSEMRHDLTQLRGNWFWFVLLGIALIIVGLVAISAVGIASIATAAAIGILMVVGGIMEVAGAFWARNWSGFFYHLLAGLLSLVVGGLFLWAPVGALVALTLLLACLLIVKGAFETIVALTHRFTQWGWALLSGVLDLLLGFLILAGWPASAFWVIGLFIGISFLFRGVNWMMLGFALQSMKPKTQPDETSQQAPRG